MTYRIYEQKVELPAPDCFVETMPFSLESAYTADQVIKLVQEGMAKALEAAAKVCEQGSIDNYTAFDCADAIHNLKGRV